MMLARPNCGAKGKRRHAFTYTEIMVACSIFLIVIAGVITSHIFGLKMIEVSQARLGANDATRKAIGMMLAEVRAAQSVRVGNFSGTNFVEAAPYSPQRGRVLQLYNTNDATKYVRYYLDTTDKDRTNSLKRIESGMTNGQVLVEAVKQTDIFTCEDFAGNTVSNRQTLCVLGLNLNFYQLKNPKVLIGPTNYYNTFTVQAKICVRSSD